MGVSKGTRDELLSAELKMRRRLTEEKREQENKQ